MFVTSKRYKKLLLRVIKLEDDQFDIRSGQQIAYGEDSYPGFGHIGRSRSTIGLRSAVRMIMDLLGVEIVRDPGTPPSHHLSSVEVDDA
jgi:hypothetical protein